MQIAVAALVAAGALSSAAAPASGQGGLAPIEKAQAASTHSPYEMGACDACHERRDPSSPGATLKSSNDLCFDCHEEFKKKTVKIARGSVHPRGSAQCTTCHNPHNSRKKNLRL